MNVKLVVVQGKPEGKEIPLRTPKFLIGRGTECHLRPNSELISRHHCLLIIGESGVTLRDLGSTNGTLVNGPTWAVGKVGNGALSFDGVNDYVNVGTISAVNGAGSVALWMKKTNPNCGAGGTGTRYAATDDSAGRNGVKLRVAQ